MGRLMGKSLWLLALVVAGTGCGGGSGVTGPSGDQPAPSISGNYTVIVEASSVCRLPVSRYQWDVVATVANDADGTRNVTVTLPNGMPDLRLRFYYNTPVSDRSRVIGTFDMAEAQFGVPISGTEYKADVFGNLLGTVTAGAGGRGEIVGGTLDGSIRINQSFYQEVATCQAADHRWSLRTR